MSTLAPHLSALPSGFAWAAAATGAFGPAALAADRCRLAVLPLHGGGDHGLGLSLDVEEVLGGAILTAAVRQLPAAARVRVLPPWRLVLAPYAAGLGHLDPETLHEVLHEIAAGVQAAGFERLLFWCTSPWNGELVDAASRDIRVTRSLQTFVIELAGLGLSLHPASPDRPRALAVATALLGRGPEAEADATAEPPPPSAVDRSFRPGHWPRIPPVRPDPTLDGPALLDAAGRQLAGLLLEVMARPGLGAAPAPAVQLEPTPPADPGGEAPPIFPGPRRPRYLPALRARELAHLPARGEGLVILPVGAIEQHGPHLPVGVDAFIGEAACGALAARLPPDAPVWFGPPMPYGKSNEHLDFPGTISLGARTLRRILLAQIEDLHGLGFRRFALLNTHGGNSAVLVYTLREMQQRWGVRAGMLRIAAPPELSAQEATWGFHAGEWETSVMLALAPAWVAMERAVCHYPARLDDPGRLRPENAPAIFSWMTRDIAPDGVMGDATAATAGKGRRWFDAAMDQLATQVMTLIGPAG